MNEIAKKNYDVPFRVKIEKQILGTILSLGEIDSSIEIEIMKHNLLPTDFIMPEHQDIMTSVLLCYKKGIAPTVVGVTSNRPEEFQHNNSEEFDYICVDILQKSLMSTATFEHDLFLLKQFVLMDFWNERSHNMLYGNWNGKDVIVVGELIVKDYDNLVKRMTGNLQTDIEDYEDMIVENVRKHRLGLTVGIPTCIEKVDNFLDGYFPGELYIIGGRPGMGKTTVALISAWECAKRGHPTAFMSLEMPAYQLKNKIISLETGLDYKDIKTGNLTDKELKIVLKAAEDLEKKPFYIYDKIKTIEDIVAKTHEAVKELGVKIMFMDYIQRTTSVQKLEARPLTVLITRELKSLAKDLYIPVVALSQLSRSVENRPNKRPRLSDLKESSSIEEDADIVVFLYRDGYYQEQEGMDVPYSELYATDYIVAKGRDTGTRTLKLFVDPVKMKIFSYNYTGVYDD